MATVPSKVAERLVAGLKRFQPVLLAAKSRDVGVSDTVTIIVDMLAEYLGTTNTQKSRLSTLFVAHTAT